ncbi:MAG TPA: UGSC family (seleno)protein [Nocardioides sp.]
MTATIRVHRPTPVVPDPIPVDVAARGAAGERPLRIGLVDNGKPKARELLVLLAEELAARVPVASTHLVSKPSAASPLDDAEADALAAASDVVVTGLGDCGACSACSLQDALLLERRGVPATVLITDVFVAHVNRFAGVLGAPGYHHLVVPHPVATKTPEHLRMLARGAVDASLAQLTAVGVEVGVR